MVDFMLNLTNDDAAELPAPGRAPEVEYDDADPRQLPTLTIRQEWRVRKQRYADVEIYRVEEVPAWDGARGFLLHRDPATIAADRRKAKEGDADVPEWYAVLVANRQDVSCECWGFLRHAHCKHCRALVALLAAGRIEHPMAGRPADPVDADAPF